MELSMIANPCIDGLSIGMDHISQLTTESLVPWSITPPLHCIALFNFSGNTTTCHHHKLSFFQQYQYDRRSYYNTVPCGFTWYNHIHIRSPNIRVTLTVTGTVCRGVWLRKFTISTSQWPIIMCIPTAPAKKVTIQDTFNLARLLDV